MFPEPRHTRSRSRRRTRRMRTEPYTPCCRHVASTPRGSRRAPCRRSLPKAQDRAVLRGGGGGVPCAWEAATRCIQPGTIRPVVPYSASGELKLGPPGDAVRGGAGCRARAGGGRAELVATHARRRRTQAVGDGRTADRGQWGIEGAGARADRDAVGSGDHDRAVGRAPRGRSWQSRLAIVAVLGALACSATLPHGCRWCGQRSVGAAAPAAGGALGAEVAGGRERRFRSAGTGRCRQPSGTGTAGHESARSNRPGRRYGRLMNDSSRPPLPVFRAAALLPEVEALVLRGWPAGATPRCRRRSTWTVAWCASACVPCNAGARPGRAASSPPWSRGSVPVPRPHRH